MEKCGGAGLAPCKIHSVALSTLFQVLLRALVSIVVQFQWRPALDDTIAMYFPADPVSLHSFPPCLLYQQRGVLFIVQVKKYRLLFIRFITGIFGRGIGTLTVRVYRCGPLYMDIPVNITKAYKKELFVSCNGRERNRVGRSVKSFFFLVYFFGQKCVFYACFTLIGSWEGEKTLG